MSVLSALQTSQKCDPSGGPFVPGSANNGLSVDPVSGKIVLGNDVGGSLATLLSDREIPMDGFTLRFVGTDSPTPGFGAWVEVDDGKVSIVNNVDELATPELSFTDNGSGNTNVLQYDSNFLLAPDDLANLIIGNPADDSFKLQVKGSAFDFTHQPGISITETGSGSVLTLLTGPAAANIAFNASTFLQMRSSDNTIATPNNVYIGDVLTAGAKLELAAGSAAAGTAPIKWNSGALLAVPVAGIDEFLTDKRYITISTGSARKEYTLNDIALTAGRVPFVTTNGRLTNDAALTFGVNTNGPALNITGSITGAAPVATLSITETWNTAGAPVVLSMSITDTSSQAFNTFLQRAIVSGTTVWSVRKDGALVAGNPGGGSGIWKLGTVIAAAVVLDATQYVEVEIDGNPVKLAIVN